MGFSDTKGGVIRREYAVDCATCPELEILHVESLHEAERMARLHGWSETEQYGWICPECRARHKSGDTLKIWEYPEKETECMMQEKTGL